MYGSWPGLTIGRLAPGISPGNFFARNAFAEKWPKFGMPALMGPAMERTRGCTADWEGGSRVVMLSCVVPFVAVDVIGCVGLSGAGCTIGFDTTFCTILGIPACGLTAVDPVFTVPDENVRAG
jgi:hypothetical protein